MAKKKSAPKKKLTRILSIDGGGIRGILPGQILVSLEKRLQEHDENARIADYFDLIAGTSTGGILTCFYLFPDENEPNRPRYTAQQAVDLYLERGDDIFDVSLWQKIRSGAGVTDEKYDASELEEALEQYFGDTKLSELLGPCLVTAYDIRRRRPHFFTSHDAEETLRDFKVRDAARATSAAPTFFEAARIFSGVHAPYPMVDGGVFANNPTLCAYSEARSMNQGAGARIQNPRAKEMMILSLGTGERRQPYPWKEAKDWGLVGWIKPLIDILMSGNSDTVDYHLKQIYDAVDAPDQYLRIEPKLNDASPALDDASPENLERLRRAGAQAAKDHEADLEKFAQALIKNH